MASDMERLKTFLETNLPDVSRVALNAKNKERLTIIPNSEIGRGKDRKAIRVYPPRKPGQEITWTAKSKAGESLGHRPSGDLRATSQLFLILHDCTGTGNFDKVKTDYPIPGQVTLMGKNPIERLIFTINDEPDSRTMHGILGLVLETAE